MNSNENDVQEQIERELAEFAEQQARDLGVHREQYTEKINTHFVASQRPTTTLFISGLTLAHDEFASAALRGIGYKAVMMDPPDNESLQFGKEFGSRGQCNPTWFTVGNLVKVLTKLRDEQGMSTEDIIANHVFLTAGACGPCRFGTYVTEYRKALRDAGFEGFRVLLFQQQGGIKQATGEELGLVVDQSFALNLVKGLIAGDVLNLLAYRMRPYEVVEGDTDLAVAECKKHIVRALENGKSVVPALYRSRRVLSKVKIDRTVPKPVVSIIGEFWAMTTEGDGNYHLQRFLEKEGAEVDIQGVTNWLLFMVWENRHDTAQRMHLRENDEARKGLEGKDPTKKLWLLKIGDAAVRGIFQTFANIIGLHGYHLPDLDQIEALAKDHYSNEVRGGEAHMEVGKLIHFVEDRLNHLTISVKPFGCMPSSGVSDGVQSLITTKWPGALFLPIETTGDGAVNVQSRVQMMLFKARQQCREEFAEAMEKTGIDEATFKARVHGSRRWRSAFFQPEHKTASSVTNLVYAVAD